VCVLVFLTVLEKYDLYEFVALCDGIRKGDLRKFNDALIEFQHQFIRYGLSYHSRLVSPFPESSPLFARD
jgi:hypothetical protein